MSRTSRKRWTRLRSRAKADLGKLRACREALADRDPPAAWTEAELAAAWEAEPETRAALAREKGRHR